MTVRVSILVTLLVTAFACASAADAALIGRIVPLTRPVPRAAPVATPAAEHMIFGEITKLGPTMFIMRLRSGRSVNVDPSSAIATGRFSAPLFVGKLILVTGALASNGTLRAQSITRIEHVDSSTRADH